MPQSQLEEILDRIHSLHLQLEEEFDRLLEEKQLQFHYTHRPLSQHDRVRHFADYGDAAAYKKEIEHLRETFGRK